MNEVYERTMKLVNIYCIHNNIDINSLNIDNQLWQTAIYKSRDKINFEMEEEQIVYSNRLKCITIKRVDDKDIISYQSTFYFVLTLIEEEIIPIHDSTNHNILLAEFFLKNVAKRFWTFNAEAESLYNEASYLICLFEKRQISMQKFWEKIYPFCKKYIELTHPNSY